MKSSFRLTLVGVLPVMRYWLPAVVWMALIFSASTESMAASQTSRFVEPFLRWLFPGISQPMVGELHFLIRKAGHLTEYAILAMLLRHAVGHVWFGGERGYWRTMAIALGCAALYAASDEFHQSFIPSRGASVVDVLIDTCGAIAGLAVLWGLTRIRHPTLRPQ